MNETLTNVDVVVYALAILGGADKTVYSEEIAAKCYELAPEKFSWQLQKYKEKKWPDKYIVKTALEDAKKKKLGGLVEGRYALEKTRDGWRITIQGMKWFKESQQRIEHVLGSMRAISKKDKSEYDRIMQHIAKHKLYKIFSSGQSLTSCTIYQFADMLGCSPDAPIDIIQAKFNRLLSIAQVIDNTSMLMFLNTFCSIFRQLGIEPIYSEKD